MFKTFQSDARLLSYYMHEHEGAICKHAVFWKLDIPQMVKKHNRAESTACWASRRKTKETLQGGLTMGQGPVRR